MPLYSTVCEKHIADAVEKAAAEQLERFSQGISTVLKDEEYKRCARVFYQQFFLAFEKYQISSFA